jgi:RNase H
MEAMAIAAAIVITPPSTPLEIHTDSKTAIHMMHRVVAPIASRELYNSPDAFIWLHLRSWLQSRGASVTLQWVRGHSGDAGNEKADRLAASAHNDHSVTQWTTRMPPPLEAPFWIMHDGRVIPRRPRRLLREQDEAITSEQLVKQVNAVPDRPDQTPEEVKHTLHVLQWTILPDGTTQKRKCWNITNGRDANVRAFGYKQLMGFLPTLARQRAWYPQVYNRPELYRCAKCRQTDETPDHIYECADHTEVETYFRDKYRTLLSARDRPIDMETLWPWGSLGLLQGRVHPHWKSVIQTLQHGQQNLTTTKAVIRQLLRASLETWYHAIWLPRCQRTIEQEQSQGLYQGAKLRRMRAANSRGTNAPPSPTPNLPRSFIFGPERKAAYGRFLLQLMRGTGRR